MEQPVVIAKLSAEVTNDGEFSVEGFRVTLAVNAVPTASMTVGRKSKEIVQSPMTSEVLAEIRRRQDLRLAGRDKTDIELKASDGVGGELKFSGFLSAPVIEISTVSTSDHFTAIGVDGMLDALDLGVYQVGWSAVRAETSSGTGVELPRVKAAEDGDVIALLDDVTTLLFDNFETNKTAESQEAMKKLMQHQHDINGGLPLEIWREMLQKSDVEYSSWQAACEKSPGLSRLMTERAVQMLTQRVGGFWATLNLLMASYQMYYIPSLSGTGRLVRADKKVGEPTASIDISATSLSLSDGSHKLMQLGGIVMMMPKAGTPDRPESGGDPKAQSIAAQFPDPLVPGFIQREVPPMWLTNGDGTPILGTSVDKAKRKAPINLKFEEIETRQSSVQEYQAVLDDAKSNVMNELCEVMFKEIQLAHSTAVATIPLDFTVKIGERTTVNILGGGSFTAFAQSVIHSVDLRQGKELNSFTQVSFTHAKY